MKKIKNLTAVSLLLFSSQIIYAQFGNSNPYGNPYGNNRRQDFPEDSKPKPIPVEVTVGKAMKKIKEDLNLDALQEIAISNLLIENMKAQGVILKREGSSEEEKTKDLSVLAENTDRKIKEFLNPEQKEKYILMAEEAKNPKAKKKKN